MIAKNSSIFKAKISHGKSYVTLINDQLTNARDFTVLDKFIYVVDDS